MFDPTRYSEVLAKLKLTRESLISSEKNILKKIEVIQCSLEGLDKAREIMNSVGILVQDKVRAVIEDLVSQALQCVFGDEYSFKIRNEIVRDKPETSFSLVISGREFSLKEEQGGGVLDVISFILRVVMWSLERPKRRNTIVLDEPGKFISKDLLQLFGVMISEVSSLLNVQFIMITHEKDLIEIADTSYLVTQTDGVSLVQKISISKGN